MYNGSMTPESDTPRDEAGILLPDINFVDHTADWAMRVRAADRPALFEAAATGLARLLVEDPAAVPRQTRREISLEAADAESLLVAWLGELAYWAETERLVFPETTVLALEDTQLRAVVDGGPAAALHNHIKAVTYHDLAIRSVPGGLEATIVFDV